MAWVESGTAPGQIIAAKVENGTVTCTRPVFPCPTVARYIGSGSIDDAVNFVPFTPTSEPDVDYHWLGEELYSHGYQAECHAEGTTLVCEPKRLILNHGNPPR